MSNPTLETTIHDLLDLKRMREEVDAEITTLEDTIKSAMGTEETLIAGAFKVTWTPYTSAASTAPVSSKTTPNLPPRTPRPPPHDAFPSGEPHEDRHQRADVSPVAGIARCGQHVRV